MTQAVVGSSIEVKANIVIPPSAEYNQGDITWKFQDQNSNVYLSGTPDDVKVSEYSDQTVLEATASLTLPNNLPVEVGGTVYQLVWTMDSSSGTFIVTEEITVVPLVSEEVGAVDSTLLVDRQGRLQAILPDSVSEVDLQLYNLNEAVLDETITTNNVQGSTKVFYKDFTPNADNDTPPSLDPYTAIWQFEENGLLDQFFGSIWVVTPSILKGMKALQQNVNRINAQARLPELAFDESDLMQFLKQGAERFNQTGKITTFTMTQASGFIEQFWIMCAQSELLRSQYLSEGMTSFEYQGQSISLTADVTDYIESVKSDLDDKLDEQIPEAKTQLYQKGITGGPGNVGSLTNKNVGVVGITASPASRFGWRGRGSRY